MVPEDQYNIYWKVLSLLLTRRNSQKHVMKAVTSECKLPYQYQQDFKPSAPLKKWTKQYNSQLKPHIASAPLAKQ